MNEKRKMEKRRMIMTTRRKKNEKMMKMKIEKRREKKKTLKMLTFHACFLFHVFAFCLSCALSSFHSCVCSCSYVCASLPLLRIFPY